MQIEIDEQRKLASIWLTKEEEHKAHTSDLLDFLKEKYRGRKYRFVIFHSGDQDLLDLTKGLLAHNKNLSEK